MPADVIREKPVREGAVTPGRTRYTMPENAVTTPIHSIGSSLFPEKRDLNIMVNLTKLD